ncbi:MAG TPA: Holliday junction resolvase RuvX [Abditibacteriaceae bacterium]|jgi:putative Holliday junction resolvase
MRFLAIDTGERRLGLALCDEAETFASAYETRTRTNARADIAALVALVTAMGVEGIVVGLPRALNEGETGDSETTARSFARKLEKALRENGRELPFFFQDERFSTREALGGLREAGISQRAARDGAGGGVDARAAAVLLQAFLDRRAETQNRADRDENLNESFS